jgi:nucleoid-associated protein YgaU
VPAPAAIGVTDRWTVQPGECFWTIAEDVLQRAWGRAPTDAEIVPYWQRLIEANRSELADPANPHLIFPDQVFRVPPPDSTPTRPPA